MDSLLPSEIARLVLGYLQDEKCDEAAKSFLEMCPHLHECRTVASTGRRFSTRVSGFTLVDILEKFCATNAIIQERLSKVSDCEQLKHCGDLLEQLRFLVDGSRGQRFVVNINVPSQTTSQASGGSPIISSSMRKRRHSGCDRDRSKRAHKSQLQTTGNLSDPIINQLRCNAVETTPLEHLPGHSGLTKSDIDDENILEKSQELQPVQCSSTVTETLGSQTVPETRRESHENLQSSSTVQVPDLQSMNVYALREKDEKTNEKCSAATDTKELMRYTNTEVQTTPYDIAESETESTDEPVENLSLLTKELLNRTELQERIAEKINKAILPADMSLRDVSMSESLGGEMNTSIMTELNNAIKSVVTATESDPVFAKFLDEIIGPNGENDTSPDEDADYYNALNTETVLDEPPDLIPKEIVPERPVSLANEVTVESEMCEVPLKNRLRSSSSQQVARPEDDRTTILTQKPIIKDDAVLEDLNAAAIFSIINANNKLEPDKVEAEPSNDPSSVNIDVEKKIIDLTPAAASDDISSGNPESSVAIENTKVNVPSKKSCLRKPRVNKPKVKAPETIPESLISEEDLMAMPTLIVCSKEEFSSILAVPPVTVKPIQPSGYCTSQFLPIAPKSEEIHIPTPETLYMKAVNVPVNIAKPKVAEEPLIAVQSVPLTKPRQGRRQATRTAERKLKNANETNEVPRSNDNSAFDRVTPNSDNTQGSRAANESITLYVNESNAGIVLEEALLPTVHVEEPVISLSGTGLSPFLKINNDRLSANRQGTENAMIAPSVPMIHDGTKQNEFMEASTSKQDTFDIIKRTPRSLLKSRSKNHRLSMSTPRRRSSHIRALDFSTPSKSGNSGRRMSTNESRKFSPKSSNFVKTVCRTSLFKSPPFTGSSSPSKKTKSPPKICRPCKIPIATRSPAPKLMGGWEKFTGVGMMIGSTSPQSSSANSSPIKATTSQPPSKSWDADLRKSLQTNEEPQLKETKTKKVPAKTAKTAQKKRRSRDKTVSNALAPRNDDDGSNHKKSRKVLNNERDSASHITLKTPGESTNEIAGLTITSDTPIEVSEKCVGLVNTEIVKNEFKKETRNANKKAGSDNPDGLPTNPDVVTTISKTSETGIGKDVIKKKYAQLKTITTNVTKIDRGESVADLLGSTMEAVDKSLEFSRAYAVESTRQTLQLPDMLDLETPRKFMTCFGIPPTPRLLSPNSSLTTPFGQVNEDSGKVRSFVTTPEFPPTPSIALTPKQLCENTEEAAKKDGYGPCSSYYQPSSELKDPRLPKQENDRSRHDMSLPLPAMIATTTETHVTNISIQVAQGFQACTTTNKLEITQFEVIKENLPREEAFKELKISTSANDSAADTAKETIDSVELNKESVTLETADSNVVQESGNDRDLSGSTIDDSSDSASSSSSDSSSSSSTSSSSSSSSCTNASTKLTFTKQYTKRTSNKIYTDTSNDSVQKISSNALPVVASSTDPVIPKSNSQDSAVASENVANAMPQNASIQIGNEMSPEKVFPIVKTDELLQDALTETPAKDESQLAEANISETPSSSKSGIDTLTNLSSKISAFITAEDREFSKSDGICAEDIKAPVVQKSVQKSLPKVVNVQRILPDVSMALKPVPVSEALYTAMQSRNHAALQPSALSDAKLSRQLEEKRLRLMAKFKEKEKPLAHRPRIKRNVTVPKAKKPTEEKSENSEKHDKNRESSMEKDSSKISASSKGKSTRTRKIDENIDRIKNNLEEEKEKVDITKTKSETGRKYEKKLKEHSVEANTAKAAATIDHPCNIESVLTFGEKDNQKSADCNVADDKQEEVISKTKSRTTETVKENIESEEKTSKQASKISDKISEELSQDNIHPNSSREENVAQGADNAKKEKEERAVHINESKSIAKSKVDLVKRDLFSDEETNDQRTTRSRTRQTSDAQKSDSADSQISGVSERVTENDRLENSEENLPGVLECLQLVPAVKNDTTDEDFNKLDCSERHAEYYFVYDDSVPTKRRKRKYSNSELEFSVQVDLSDENCRTCSKVMTATVFEEIFNLSPPRKKRTVTKESNVKSVKYKKKEGGSTLKSLKSMVKDISHKPLATSSPVLQIATSKIISKTVKSPSKKTEGHQSDAKRKPSAKSEKQSDHEKQNPKSRKRKTSVSREIEQVEKKPRTTDPHLLLSTLDLDKFLTTVHGPA